MNCWQLMAQTLKSALKCSALRTIQNRIEVGDKVKLKRGIYRNNQSWDWTDTGGFICDVIGIEVGDGISFSHRLFFGDPSVVYIIRHNQAVSAVVDSEINRIV